MKHPVEKVRAALVAALLYLWPPIHDDVPVADRRLAGAAGTGAILIGMAIAAVVVLLVVLR